MIKLFLPLVVATLISTSAIAQNANDTKDTMSFAKIEQQLETTNQEVEKLKLDLGKFGSIKISGYIQGQFQWAQEKGIAAFGDGGKFAPESDTRFMIRRGRIKFTYSKGIVTAVIQPDFTEKGVYMKDAYVAITTNNKAIGGQVGLFDRPFGYEISYSSSLRESAERSRVYLSLFPGEREVGAMLTLQGAKGKGWLEQFTLNAGLFNGNGIGIETDSKKDFIGRLAWLKKWDNTQLGIAGSVYIGGTMNPVGENYTYSKGVGFEKNEVDKGTYAERNYYGAAAQFLQYWGAGATNIRAEWLWGSNPGTAKANANPGGSSFGTGTDPLYLRKFMGGYAILVQDIGLSKHSVVLKYDYYDPNTAVKGDQIGKLAGTGVADIAYSTFGFGYLFRLNSAVRLMAYYDIVNNEISQNLVGFNSHIKQNVLTIRAQVKF